MKNDGLCFDFPILDIDFISAEYNGNVFAHANQIAVPVGDILVGDSCRDVEHNDSTLALDVVAVAKTAKLLLSCRVPNVEENWPSVCVKR